MEVGDQISSYTLVRKIAAGGMGEVWEAFDTTLKRPVAIKCVQEHASADPSFVQRFRIEAQTLARLHHPGIVSVYSCVEVGDRAYLVMELVHGRTLGEIVRTSGPRSVGQCVEWFKQAASALSYAHANGVCHRDIKPSNIMIDENSNVHLIDFGIALSANAEARLTRTGDVVGTAAYMAPEQYRFGEADYRSDVYSLALTMYFAMTGINSARYDDGSHAYEPLDQFPAGIDGLMRKCLNVYPDCRFSDGEELAAELTAVGLIRLRRSSPHSNRLLVYAVAAVALIGVGMLGTLAMLRARPSPPRNAASSQTIHEPNTVSVETPPTPRVNPLPSDTVAQAAQNTMPEPSMTPPPAANPSDESQLATIVKSDMVRVPEGDFTAGMDEADVPEALHEITGWQQLTQGARRRVFVAEFKIDRYEVTNAEYAQFVRETGRACPPHWTNGMLPPGMENHPVVNVTYADAEAFAEWAGKRLPTADEWEKAARGTDARLYPWGNQYDGSYCNTGQVVADGTCNVDSFPGDQSPYGIVGMGGNAAEWTSTSQTDAEGNKGRVICGGSWLEAGEIVALSSFRRTAVDDSVYRPDVSFRCAR